MSDYYKLYELNKPVQGKCLYTHIEITVSHERICGRTKYRAYYTYCVPTFDADFTYTRTYPFDSLNKVKPVGNINGYARASKQALEECVNEAIEFYNKICLAGNEIGEW